MVSNPYTTATVEAATDWRDQAACLGKDPELWFAPQGSPEMGEAKQVCTDCKVRMQCLAEALQIPYYDDHGVLGGLDKAERDRIRKATA